MGLLIRAATAADIPAITAIYDHAVRHGTASFELEPPDAAEMARRHATLALAGFPYLVAEADGAVAGYAYAGPYRPRPAYRWSVEDSVYVAPALHRRGIGAIEHVGFKFERWLDTVLMQRALGRGADAPP